MTKRAGRSAGNDEVLAEVVNAGTGTVCLVGKSHDFHVTEALGIELPENLTNIGESIQHLVGIGLVSVEEVLGIEDRLAAQPD